MELVARMENKHIDFLLGHLMERDNLEDLDLDGNVILKCVLNRMRCVNCNHVP